MGEPISACIPVVPVVLSSLTVTHAIGAAMLFAALIFVVVWNVVYRKLKEWDYVTFTPRRMERDPENNDELRVLNEKVDFEPRHAHYMKTAEVIITLASASLVFIPTLHMRAFPRMFAFSMVLLGLSVLLCVSFMVFLTYFYENFLWLPTTYTAKRSASLQSLGFTGLACFAAAYCWRFRRPSCWGHRGWAFSQNGIVSDKPCSQQLSSGKLPNHSALLSSGCR